MIDLFNKNEIRKETYVVSMSDLSLNSIDGKVLIEDVEEFNFDKNNQDYIYAKKIFKELCYYTCSNNIINKDGNHQTVCHIISKEEYENNLSKSDKMPIKAKHYIFIDDGEIFRLIIYSISNESTVILERYVVNEKRTKLPSFIKRAINVENDFEYINHDEVYLKKR